MKVLIINGATKAGGNTDRYSQLFESILKSRGHEIITVDKCYSDCIDCGACINTKKCAIKDEYSDILFKFDFDWVVIFSPIYFFGMSGKAKTLLDRLYCVDKRRKIISSVTFSGSNTKATSGHDLVWTQITRIADYCAMYIGDSPNFCTNDLQLDNEVDIENIKEELISTIEENEALYNEISESRKET